MLDDLDRIPWDKLGHAYGTAEDVPTLLRDLATASPDVTGEDSPLWHLFGNIWHQGTINEATSYAVPFLIELAEYKKCHHRGGVLALLSAIWSGTSFLQVHGPLGEAPIEELEATLSTELEWVTKAKVAVSAGFDCYVRLAKEDSKVRQPAIDLLAKIDVDNRVAPLVRQLLDAETDSESRAMLLLTLGRATDGNAVDREILTRALESADPDQRNAAALAFGIFELKPFSESIVDAIAEAIVNLDVQERIESLLSDPTFHFDKAAIVNSLKKPDQVRITTELVELIEKGKTKKCDVFLLLSILFPLSKSGRRKQITPNNTNALQKRAIKAFARMVVRGRQFNCDFAHFGLPSMNRDWKNLAAGLPPIQIDLTLPMFSDPETPHLEIPIEAFTEGQRVRHRHFGCGTIQKIRDRFGATELKIKFDEEATHTFSF